MTKEAMWEYALSLGVDEVGIASASDMTSNQEDKL